MFNRPNLYSRRRWRRLQHIAGEFWSRWQKEFLQSLQARQKWNISKRNFQVGDVVLLKEDTGRNKWPIERVVSTKTDSQSMVQVHCWRWLRHRTITLRSFDDQSVRLCCLWKMSMVQSLTKVRVNVEWISSWNTTWGETYVVVQCKSGVVLICKP